MTDDLFRRLLELFESPGPVNWKLAAEVARSVAGSAEPIDPSLAEEYRELTRTAQMHVARSSELDTGPLLDADPVDRRGWADANLQGFRYLVEPLARRMAEVPAAGPLDDLLRPLTPALLGMQMGLMVGFLSRRVLGQFDVGLPAGERPHLYLVVPNIEAFADDFDLDPRQVRLWVALHEVTHQAEFAVPWVRPRFVELIETYVEGLELDPEALAARVEGLRDPEELQRLMGDPAGLAGFLAGPAQREGLDRIQAFMAVMEGYGEFVMGRAAPPLLPQLPRMREAMRRRRAEASPGEQVLQRLLGLELKRRQYELGAEFCAQVERRWGSEALAALWEDADHLPTLGELEDPVAWAARVLLPDVEGSLGSG